MRRPVLPLAALILLGLLAEPSGVLAQIVSPRDGGQPPEAYLRVLQRDPDAFQFQRAWIQKAARAKELRELAVARGELKAAELYKVSGTFQIPVFTVTFTDTASPPYPSSDLQTGLFGPSPAVYDLTEYYQEISFGNVTAQGTVYDWVPLPNDELYYTGGVNGLDPAFAKIGELIQGALDAQDAVIDFGIYDNDGPDGIPNSGDDDGYVDFVAFVHPEFGAECGGDNEHIWSHRWVYRGWPASGGAPYPTDDPCANGGTILVDDYVIQPAISCAEGGPMIEIGVFCHEFGHAFGLPDLYDTNGGGSGLGHWGLMASGNWNRPATPAHMSAWSKIELGWVSPIQVGWQGATLDIPPAAMNPVAYELLCNDDRWTRRDDCAINGSYSLALGLNDAEAAARGWAGGKGYGNRWYETIVHDFHTDGASPVSLDFDWSVDSEAAYDYAFCYLEVDSTEILLQAYDGLGTGSSLFDLTGFLGALPADYHIKFRFVSDYNASDEDGLQDSACAAFVIDDLSLTGGGEAYSADFEEHIGGWYQPLDELENPVSEKWLVENRQRQGSDIELHGEGLLIVHVDEEVAHSGLRNTGGYDDLSTRGVAVEEADDLDHLLEGINRGDDGDVWPGSSLQTVFGPSSSPSSMDNGGHVTPIEVSGIASKGQDMSATLVGGDPAPAFTGVIPDAFANDAAGSEAVALSLDGASGTRHGVTVRLVRDGFPEIVGEVDWLDRDRVDAVVDLVGAEPGYYDLVVENPDGQTAVVSEAFRVLTAVAAPSPDRLPERMALAQNYPNPFNPSTTIRYQVDRGGPVSLQVFDVRGRVVRTLVSESKEPGWYQVRWNGTDDAGRAVASGLYFYRMRAGDFQDQRKLLLVK